MDRVIPVACPKCGKQLKAPSAAAGKRVKCPRPACQTIFVVPGPAQPVYDLDDAPADPPAGNTGTTPGSRQLLQTAGWATAGICLLALVIGGAYWWTGRPGSALVAAYEGYIKTGNELADLHDGVTDRDSAKRLEGELKAKAEEHLQFRKQKDDLERTTSGRKLANAKEKFEQPIAALNERLFKLVLSEKPLVITTGVGKDNEYVVLAMGSYYSKSETPVPVAPATDQKPAAQNWKLESFAGHWRTKGFAFRIEPDGRGNAEFENFSQGTGGFTVSQGGKPVLLTADFRIESRGGRPVFSFELTPSKGVVSRYEFEILPPTGAEELKVKELGGGRINPNPAVMKRFVAPIERWELVDTSKGRRYTVALCDAPGGMVLFGGQPCVLLEETPGKGVVATPQLDAAGHLWIVGKGGVTWKGTRFPAGSIVAVGEDRQPKLAEGQFRAWFETSKPVPAYASADASGPLIHTFPANAKIRLLVPDSDKAGYHKVSVDEQGKTVAWISAAAGDELVFTELVDGPPQSPQGP
jgi:hypothetical protein